MTLKRKLLLKFLLIIVLAFGAGLVSYPNAVKKIPPVYNALNKLKINLGLDLQGGIHLEYKADLSNTESSKVNDAMQAAQDVIERRVNAFGVAEPMIYTTRSGSEHRLIVELAGVKDIEKAKEMIKETPFLEFKEEKTEEEIKETEKIFDSINEQTKRQAEEILQRALNGENFEELVKKYSEDPGSKDAGGDLGFTRQRSR